jgi:hypothetical protein
VVALARSASKAARVAARGLGQLSRSRSTKLTHLDSSRNAGAEDPSSDIPSDLDAPEAPESPESPRVPVTELPAPATSTATSRTA